jgi:hypothetical protein
MDGWVDGWVEREIDSAQKADPFILNAQIPFDACIKALKAPQY